MEPAWIEVPAGRFSMGSEAGLPDERPVHRVWVDAFVMARVPVTNEEYHLFVDATGRPPPPAWQQDRLAAPRQPVVAVSWFDAVAYCLWLSDRTGLPCRLPTEAERERATRGGRDDLEYPWGDRPGDAAGPLPAPPPVGGGRPNGFGLYHTADLVHEWCADWYAADCYATSLLRNPGGPASGQKRTSRGGSWRHRITVTRSAARSSLRPEQRYTDYGFRVVATVDRRC